MIIVHKHSNIGSYTYNPSIRSSNVIWKDWEMFK